MNGEALLATDYSELNPSWGAACRSADESKSNKDRVARSDTPPSGTKDLNTLACPVMAEAAYHGLAGKIVRTIEPHSEADPVALLLQFLTLAGNVVGPTAYWQVESDRHHANLFAVLVGASSKGRKGTSLNRVKAVVQVADEIWAGDRIKGGLSSGEGLINEVRDERKEWDKKEKQFEIVDPGVSDKRLMVVEPEFAGLLSVAERHGNTISPLIRRAWDGDKLQTITKGSPLCATGAHISIVGHITADELQARITRTDIANGFANRFLFALVKRSKTLPFGGGPIDDDLIGLGTALRGVVENAKCVGRVGMTPGAQREWQAVYGELTSERSGLLGAITARADPQTLRLAMIYALLDGRDEIDEPHLRAALAVWEYSEASAARIFGNSLGDPVADDILRALQQAGIDGMTRTAIRDLFGRHQSGERIGAALALLAARGRARTDPRETKGRAVEVRGDWRSRRPAACSGVSQKIGQRRAAGSCTAGYLLLLATSTLWRALPDVLVPGVWSSRARSLRSVLF